MEAASDSLEDDKLIEVSKSKDSPVVSDEEEEIDRFMIQATLKSKDVLSNSIVDLWN